MTITGKKRGRKGMGQREREKRLGWWRWAAGEGEESGPPGRFGSKGLAGPLGERGGVAWLEGLGFLYQKLLFPFDLKLVLKRFEKSKETTFNFEMENI
jgi:hypothetical protein